MLTVSSRTLARRELFLKFRDQDMEGLLGIRERKKDFKVGLMK